MREFQDKVAIVTGASRGVGRAIALMLANEGCQVAFNYHKSQDKALELQKEMTERGSRCTASCVDIKDFEAVKKWIEETKEKFGRLDFLINNAGIIIDKALVMMTKSDWQDVMDTNLTGTFNATRNAIFTFLKQKNGSIVNISSVSGVIGLPRQTNYSATKGGINAFTKALAKEVALYGIRVNAVAPGFIDTDILSGFSAKQKKNILQEIPLGRLGKPEEVAACVQFLLSQRSEYMTGQVIQIDGGLAIR